MEFKDKISSILQLGFQETKNSWKSRAQLVWNSKTRFYHHNCLHISQYYFRHIITNRSIRTLTINNAHKSLPPSYLSLSVSDRCKWPRAPFNHNGFNFTSGGIVSRCSVIALADATESPPPVSLRSFRRKGKTRGPASPKWASRKSS